jgi:outer membrane protein
MDMRIHSKVASVALVMLAGFCSIAAQAQAQSKVGVIDVRRLVTDSREGKEVLTTLQQLSDDKSAQLRSMTEELEQLQGRITEGRLSLSEERLAQMQKEFEDKRIDLGRARDDAERELQKLQTDRFGEIERKIMPIINQVGVELGYTMIFNKFESGLVFAQEAADITDMILQRFDSESATAGAVQEGGD